MQMQWFRQQDLFGRRMMGLWAVLAFQAGFINSIGFLACKRFVSHVTGFGSQLGIAIGKGDFLYGFEVFSLPVAFIAGGWLNGHLTVVRKARGLTPRYDWVGLVIPVVMSILLVAGTNEVFGAFGEHQLLGHELVFPMCLAFACGVQNACFTTLTNGQIRTTHLTGLSTDLGTDLALSLGAGLPEQERTLLKKKNLMRVLTVVFFSVGALLSALLDAKLEYWSLGVPLATSLGVAGCLIAAREKAEERAEAPEEQKSKMPLKQPTAS